MDNDGEHPTCLAYLRELGITHVQLMPVYDYGSVDEEGDDSQFNWGYDPLNYNVPEGSYSTNPHHGEVRIRELKEAIQALHKNGFRFDLMGLLDVELMERIRTALDQRWGKGEKMLFGEPWSARGTAARPGTLLADKKGLPALNPATGAFCDATRDAGPYYGGQGECARFCQRRGAERRNAGQLSPGLDWRRARDNQALVDYYRGLIALRMCLPGLQDKSSQASSRVTCVQELVRNCVTAQVDNGDSPWWRLFLAYSTRRTETELPLPEGAWELLADGQSSFLWQSPQTWTKQYPLAPVSAAIFGQR